MLRAVTCDHVLFDECIYAFRNEDTDSKHSALDESYSYLLTSFPIRKDWDLGICNVSKTTTVKLAGSYYAFISRIKNPPWIGDINAHLFGLALSTIFSAITLKTCKSTRDDYLCQRVNLTEDELGQLAILHPILTAGPGYTNTKLSQAKENQMQIEVSRMVNKLMLLDYSKYIHIMQCLRLIYLSISTKRDDFGLSYLLAVSAIESMAQTAIARDKVKIKHPKESTWKMIANSDECFKELFEEYKQSRGKNEYLKERFIAFILKYAPVDKWLDYVEHPMQELADYIKEQTPNDNIDDHIKKHWAEKYPQDLSSAEIKHLLSDAYVHRSCFVHRGEQPPHRHPHSYINRFFQEITDYNQNRLIQKTLPNYELIINLAKNSISNWIDEQLNN